jgi:acetyl-CoA C-acetyltransferase
MAERIADRTPVLVGVGAIRQREDDPGAALEPVALMAQALQRAADDAGAPALLARADRVLIPRGFWDYPDPGRLVAERVGAASARTLVAEIGVLQTTLLAEAVRAIAAGEADVVLATGGEAKYRAARALSLGVDAPTTQQPRDTRPDAVLAPHEDILHPLELERGIVLPVAQYAMMESALRYADGMTLAAHRAELGELWASYNRVAASNPVAWSPEPRTAAEIATAGSGNPMLAFPYTKRLTSQWNVDQAAGLILCAVGVARALRVPEARWVFPLGVAESNHMVPLAERAHIARCPGFAIAGQRLAERVGIAAAAADVLEVYSCFPAAVRLQCRELGIDHSRTLTVTGGMAFAGGPLNNFVLQAMVRTAEVLRSQPGATALVTAVSGMVTKQGVSLWASRAPQRRFTYDDVAAEVATATETVQVVGDRTGTGRVAAYTVLHDRGTPRRGVALVDFTDGTRTLATTDDAAQITALLAAEGCGRIATVHAGGEFTLGRGGA